MYRMRTHPFDAKTRTIFVSTTPNRDSRAGMATTVLQCLTNQNNNTDHMIAPAKYVIPKKWLFRRAEKQPPQ